MPPPYKPVGQCIYCDARFYSEEEPNHKLGNEHIIPQMLKGTVELPDASCKRCEVITSSVETKCTPLYDPGRHHLGIRGARRKKLRPSFNVKVGLPAKNIKVGRSDHPGVLWGFEYSFPGILLDIPPGGEFAGNVRMASAVPDMKARLGRLGPMHVNIGAGVSYELFGRMLAKIAHAFAVAERGISGFSPLLLDVIKGERLDFLPWLIGCPIGDDVPASGPLHEIGFAEVNPQFLTVRIRLFAAQHLPTYYVVAGRSQ